MFGVMQKRTNIMPRSLTTPGGVRFLDPAHYVSQEELDRRDRRWRAMRERAYARHAAAAASVFSNGSSAASASWADDTATLVGSVRYYAAASTALREWEERNAIGAGASGPGARRSRSRPMTAPPAVARTGSMSSMAGADGTASDGTTLGRRATHASSVEEDGVSEREGDAGRGRGHGLVSSRSSSSSSNMAVGARQPRRSGSGSGSMSMAGSMYRGHHQHLHAPHHHNNQQHAPPHSGARRGAARLSTIRDQMRRRKISEALQRLIGAGGRY